MPGCTPLLKDPTNHYWALSVLDTGMLTTTAFNFPVKAQNNPILLDPNGKSNWQLSADATGRIISTQVGGGGVVYIPLMSPRNLNYIVGIDASGLLFTSATTAILPDIIPYPIDVAMSVYGNGFLNPPVTCPNCGNASVTVSADESCWCCTCRSFVLPEDTTIIVILDE